jgi:uncharacterized protein YggE
LPTPFALRTVVLVALFAFAAGCLAAVAQAQDTAPAPQRTLVASGTGQAKPTPKDRNDNASIAAAVEKAEAKALPLAVADARAQAQALAGATGVTLGALLSVSNGATANGFYGPVYYGFNGTFGPGKFCGTIRSRRSTVDANGKRHLGKLRTRRVCRVPPTVQRQVALTFALS